MTKYKVDNVNAKQYRSILDNLIFRASDVNTLFKQSRGFASYSRYDNYTNEAVISNLKKACLVLLYQVVALCVHSKTDEEDIIEVVNKAYKDAK